MKINSSLHTAVLPETVP